MILRPDVPMIKPVKMHSNVGACYDIPTGTFLKGKYGENLLKGGLPAFFGLSGKANNFKSTILAWLLLVALVRLTNHASSLSWYDTEVNVELVRLAYLASEIEGYEDFTEANGTVFDRGLWVFTDKANMSGNKWVSKLQEFLSEKVKSAKSLNAVSPFLDLDKSLIEMIMPTASAIDTISEFETDDVLTMRDKTEIGQKEGNMINMRQGLGKDRLIRESPSMASRSSHFIGMNAQYGEEKADINASPMSGPKPKKMNTLRPGEKVRGVPDSFLYLPLHLWLIDGSSVLRSEDKQNAEFPLEENGSSESDDLYVCPMKMLRSKTGPSGFTINILVSQKRGVLPTMTEFYNILRTSKRYGLEGNDRSYNLALLPDVTMQRTTVRKRIATDPLLRRAMNITSEIAQMEQFYPAMKGNIPPLSEIRKKLISDGYDMNQILSTRPWWTFNNDKQKVPFLSSMDIIDIFNNEYTPYWLESDKRTVRKEFVCK